MNVAGTHTRLVTELLCDSGDPNDTITVTTAWSVDRKSWATSSRFGDDEDFNHSYALTVEKAIENHERAVATMYPNQDWKLPSVRSRTGEQLSVEQARQHILGGGTVKVWVGSYNPDDPILKVYLEDGMIMSTAIAGWSEGITEPVCEEDSPFIYTFLSSEKLEAM